MTWQLYWPGWWRRLWPTYRETVAGDESWQTWTEWVFIWGPLQMRGYK